MSSLIPRRFAILPHCLSLGYTSDQALRVSGDFSGFRSCVCAVEILRYESGQKLGPPLHSWEQNADVSEFAADGGANSIGLFFESPFYMDGSRLLVGRNDASVLSLADIRYQIRVRFAPKEERISLESNGVNQFILAKADSNVFQLGSGTHAASILHWLLMDTEGGDQQDIRINELQLTAWHVIIRCWWEEGLPESPGCRVAKMYGPPILPTSSLLTSVGSAAQIIEVSGLASPQQLPMSRAMRSRDVGGRRRSERLQGKASTLPPWG